jgi:DNA-binding transcriptional MerR regulator
MHTFEQAALLLNASNDGDTQTLNFQSDYSVGEMAAELGITPRALRFYESKGLLSPMRREGMRFYGNSDRERIALILKLKKFGFTLIEIKDMIRAREGRTAGHTVKLSPQRCNEQIEMLERQVTEIQEALAELRQFLAVLP